MGLFKLVEFEESERFIQSSPINCLSLFRGIFFTNSLRTPSGICGKSNSIVLFL